MPSVAQFCAGAFTVVLLTDYFAVGSAFGLRAQGSAPEAKASLHDVNRTGKGDRLAVARAGADQGSVATVEVVGLRNTAVIYRDRDGRILFQSDPVSNATVVAKDVVLPEVTIRDSARSKVRQVPVTTRDAAPSKIPDGCDPSFSPLSVKANVTGRCVASIDVPVQLASLH